MLIRPHHDRRIGSSQRSQRFAHRARGKEPSVAEAARGVDQHEVEVALEPHMLKTVVEDYDVEGEAFSEQLDRVDSAARDRYRPGERLRHHDGLVAGFIWAEQRAVGDKLLAASAPAPSTAHDPDVQAFGSKARGEKQRKRGLAVAADGQISHADRRHASVTRHHPPPWRSYRESS